MKIYTRGGDKGMTSLIGGRVKKNNVKVEAYGTIDELNGFVGLAQAKACTSDATSLLANQLNEIMHELFDTGSDLAYVEDPVAFKMKEEPILRLEQWIDDMSDECPPLTKFILPGGTELAATLHICRTVCRRAERAVVTLTEHAEINEYALSYLNRLSDYFFAAARYANMKLGTNDTEYIRSANVFQGKKK